MLRHARELGLSTQVNTTVSRYNLDDFDALCTLMTELGIALWSVFFLVPTGRARAEEVAGAAAFEAVFQRMYELSRTAPFDIKSTAAPQYRRVVVQRQVAERRAGGRTSSPDPIEAGPGFTLADGIGRARGMNDGDGLVFVAHDGAIQPSGFLPVSAGNVRCDDLLQVYRTAPLFLALRDRDRLRGKCGVCEYREICGGSRARAYATTGDWLEADPYCTHEPTRWQRMVARGQVEPTEAYFARRMPQGASLPVLDTALADRERLIDQQKGAVMSSTTQPRIDARATVNQTVRAFPGTMSVFAQAGIDTCCGGALPIEEAARRHQVELDALLAALAVAAAAGAYRSA